MGNFAEFCGRHAAVMGPAEEQLRLGNLTAENLKDVIIKLVEIEKSGTSIVPGPTAPEASRDPRLRGRSVGATTTTVAALPSLPHVVEYGHGCRSPAKTKGQFLSVLRLPWRGLSPLQFCILSRVVTNCCFK